MKVKINIAVTDIQNPSIKNIGSKIYTVSKNVSTYLSDKHYGNDLETLSVVFLIVKSRIGYEKWYIPKRPVYFENKQVKNFLTKEYETVIKTLHYEIRLSDELYDKYLLVNDTEGVNVLIDEFLKSLSDIKWFPKKIKDFDVERFKNDFMLFFKSYSFPNSEYNTP